MVLMDNLQKLVIWWVTPASLYFAVGWELRIRRTIAVLCFTIFGLVRLFVLARHSPSPAEIFFGINDCPPSTAEFITSATWTFLQQLFSGLLWSPLSWLSRRLSTGSSLVLIKYLKLALLLPVQLLRALFYTITALIVGILWVATSFGAPLLNVFTLPLSIFVSISTLWLIFLHFIAHETELPLWSRVALSDTTALLRISFSPEHALQVLGRILAGVGFFGCRDRWLRRDTLQAGIREAVIATLPGLIGPITVDQEDISDAVDAVRGLSNKWSDLEEKERLLDDKGTLVYTLSYKHIPVWEGKKMIRLSEERAMDILRRVLSTAKEHGYQQVMLWCDGASVAGVRVDRSWVDIGLLPYTLYRTFRVESFVNNESLSKERLWLDLEKGLSELTCGMDVTEEHISDGGVEWVRQEGVEGRSHKAMGAALRVSAHLTQGVYAACAVSRDADRAEIRAWARRMLRRSGVREMNEGLGWATAPAADRRAKAVLLRVSTLKPRAKDKGARGEVAWVARGARARAQEDVTPGDTQFWLGLLGFEAEEIAEMRNEQVEFFTSRFAEGGTGRWEMVVANLQGDYFVSMGALRSVETGLVREWDGWLLVTNSQVEKQGKVEEWVAKMAEEAFGVVGHKSTVSEVTHDFVEDQERDTPVAWFSAVMGVYADWQHDLAGARRARMAREAGVMGAEGDERGGETEEVATALLGQCRDDGASNGYGGGEMVCG